MDNDHSAIEDQTAVLRSDASATINEVRESFPPPVGLPVDAPPWNIRKVASHTLRRRETLGVNETTADDAASVDGFSFERGLR